MTTVAQILDEDNPDAEGSYVGSELHALTCPCPDCATENARIDAAVDANLEANAKAEAEAEAAKWWAEYQTEVLKVRYFAFLSNATEESWQEYLEFQANPVKPAPMPKPPIEAIADDTRTVSGRTSEGLRQALRGCMVWVRYNAREHRAEITNWLQPWEPLTDRIVAKLREVLAESFVYIGPPGKDGSEGEPKALKFGLLNWNDALNALLYGSEIDPFIEWLESLDDWDGTPRLENLLPTLFTISKWPDLAEWAGRHLYLGAVWRAYQPGKKFDEMPVLIGRGGIGKSTFARFMLPADRGEWFSDGLHLAADTKTRAESLQGRVVVEAAEMAGSTRADLESLKVFISQQDDGAVRLAYWRDPETLLRRCVLVGTTDRAEPLPNDSNLRRFVPVYLDDGNVDLLREYMDRHRKQLWAEALRLYHRDLQPRLPEHLKEVQREATDRARSRDSVVEDAIAEWTRGNDGFTMAELAAGIHLIDSNAKGARLQMRDQHRLGNVLESEGFTKRQELRNGVRRIRWFRHQGERVAPNP